MESLPEILLKYKEWQEWYCMDEYERRAELEDEGVCEKCSAVFCHDCNYGKIEQPDLRFQDFSNLDLTNFNFYSADLRGVNFENSCLQYVKFCSANIEDVNLKNADLYKANFYDAVFKGTYENLEFKGTRLEATRFVGCELININFNCGYFRFCSFIKSNLYNPNLRTTSCSNATFRATNIYNPQLQDMGYYNCNFRDSKIIFE